MNWFIWKLSIDYWYFYILLNLWGIIDLLIYSIYFVREVREYFFVGRVFWGIIVFGKKVKLILLRLNFKNFFYIYNWYLGCFFCMLCVFSYYNMMNMEVFWGLKEI